MDLNRQMPGIEHLHEDQEKKIKLETLKAKLSKDSFDKTQELIDKQRALFQEFINDETFYHPEIRVMIASRAMNANYVLWSSFLQDKFKNELKMITQGKSEATL